MPDTVFPYGDDDVDPYSGGDTKNPHEETEGEEPEDDEETSEEETPEPAPRKATRTTKTAKKT